MEVEAAIWLQRRSHWLNILGWVSLLRRDIAINHLEIEVNIGVLWDVSIPNWGLDQGRAPNLVSWALDPSLGAWMELLDGQLPALEHVCASYVEGACSAVGVFGTGIGDDSSVLELAGPVDLGPLSSVASVLIGIALFDNVHSKVGVLNGSVSVLVALSVWTKNVWQCLHVDGLNVAEQNSWRKCNLFHLFI
jgi:hypothetical protein